MPPKRSAAALKVNEVLEILAAVGFPLSEKTPAMQRRMARILLAVCNVAPKSHWSATSFWQNADSWCPRSRDIIKFVNSNYGEDIADSSYDDIRRKNLEFLVAAGLIVGNPGRPEAAHHDGTRGYAVNPAAVDLFRHFGTPKWKASVGKFRKNHPPLKDLLARKRHQEMVSVVLPQKVTIELSKGAHNTIQKAVVEQFLPRFAPGGEVLYIGDFAKKTVFIEETKLKALKFFELGPGRLPDIVAYDARRNWLFLIEAVHSANPVSPLRHLQLEKLASDCTAGIVYVSAFVDRKTFARWLPEISWETEVWLVEAPDHMVHFNGDKFLGPHSKRTP